MSSNDDRQTIGVTLPASTVELIEEAARERNSSVDEQAGFLMRLCMPTLHPPKTDAQWVEEMKEVNQDFSMLRGQYFDELREKSSGKDEGAERPDAEGASGEARGEGERVITITLSKYRVGRLREIADERGTSVAEEAARLIQYAVNERHGPATEEERAQQATEALEEMGETWKDIMKHFGQG